jgi:hypothetical protein
LDAVDLVRSQYKGAHDLLEATMGDMTPDQAHWAPPGVANPAGASYSHMVGAEDFLISTMVRGTKPLAMGDFAGKTGVSEPPPPPGPGLDAWCRRVQVDLSQAKAYAQAVYKQTDDWLATLSAADLDKPIDMTSFGMGQQPMATLVANIIIQHLNNHLGEISCLKGLQGAKGYPY